MWTVSGGSIAMLIRYLRAQKFALHFIHVSPLGFRAVAWLNSAHHST